MRSEAFFRLITRSQKRLNMIVIALWVLKLLSLTSLIAGFLIVLLRSFGWPVNLLGWSIITLAGGLAGLVLGWRNKLDQYKTACWLDEYLHDDQALSAAVFCFNRNCNGVPDQFIIERADNVAVSVRHIHWPLRIFSQWLGLSTVILISTGLMVYFWFPTFRKTEAQIPKTISSDKLQPKLVKKTVPELKQTPKEFGKALFPQDEKLARQVEKALQEGDFNTLNSLFKQANLNMEQKIAKASPADANRLRNEQQKAKAMMQQMPNSRNGKSQGNKSTNDNKGGKSNNGNQKGRQGNGEDQSNARQGEQSGQGKNGPKNGKQQYRGSGNSWGMNNYPNSSKPSEESNGKANSGKQAGKGSGKKNGDRGEVAAQSGKEKALIAPRENSSDLEMILPGKNARVPLTDILPDLQRAAETALIKDGVPIEYEDFAGSYFQKLAESLKEGQE